MSANVLVIDDEPVVCRSCEKILTGDGHNVSIALSGREGLERARRENFDLVIVDLKMPDMDGMKVVEAIRKERPDMAVIIMTGYSTVPSAVKGMKLGAADYVPKPFTPDEMSAAAKEALQQKEREVEAKTAMLEVLHRAAGDREFKAALSEHGPDALDGYDLSPAEKAALASLIHPSEEAIRVVSHELKSPLASISSLAMALQEPSVTGDQKDKFLNRIIYRAQGALGMIDEYLTMSKISSGEVELKLGEVNLYHEVIEKALDDQRESMAERGMRASIHIPEDLEIVCDPGYLGIVYDNLVSNATKYGEANTEMLLGYSGELDGYHRLCVANVGEWIKVADRKRIFEKYVTLGRRGTGVGLHTTMKIVKLHGGDIWVEPCYLDGGKCITVESVTKEIADVLMRGNSFVFTIPARSIAGSDSS